MKSVLQTNKECYVCGTTYNLHDHHCIYGTSNRKHSERYGLKVWLCAYHHNMSNDGVHFNQSLDLHLKQKSQMHFENNIGTRQEFLKIFGRSWL